MPCTGRSTTGSISMIHCSGETLVTLKLVVQGDGAQQGAVVKRAAAFTVVGGDGDGCPFAGDDDRHGESMTPSVRLPRGDREPSAFDLAGLLHRPLQHDDGLIGPDGGYLRDGSAVSLPRDRRGGLGAVGGGDG